MLRKKLITCDTIIPICLQLNKSYGFPCRFFTTDPKTFNQIKKNVVLSDALNEVGSLILIGKSQYKIIRRIQIALFLIFIAMVAVRRKTYLIHFGQFNTGIFRAISYLFSNDRIIFSANDATGYSTKMFEIEYAKSKRELTIENSLAPTKGMLLSYCEDWPWLHDERTRRLKRFIVPHPRKMSVWTSFVTHKAKAVTNNISLKEKVVVIMLGSFGDLGMVKNENSIRNCFIDTLKCLEYNHCEHATVILKPHVITNMVTLNDIMRNYPDLDFKISYLHPALLARFANVFLCNAYTTSVYDAFIQNVPVIEYTEYHPDALRVSGNKSSRPEYVTHFINKDPKQLQKALAKILNSDKPSLKLPKIKRQNEFFDHFTHSSGTH